jgi:hypothetical protein
MSRRDALRAGFTVERAFPNEMDVVKPDHSSDPHQRRRPGGLRPILQLKATSVVTRRGHISNETRREATLWPPAQEKGILSSGRTPGERSFSNREQVKYQPASRFPIARSCASRTTGLAWFTSLISTVSTQAVSHSGDTRHCRARRCHWRQPDPHRAVQDDLGMARPMCPSPFAATVAISRTPAVDRCRSSYASEHGVPSVSSGQTRMCSDRAPTVARPGSR